ncbi:hypothetical protein G6L37_06220 [Agrobacterium rubi]|nr:hypothetical protein [Agrobacterium rubi]NTF24957.1 hypothetical protein [Agrobacterium rubi]
MSIKTVEITPMTSEVTKPVLDRLELARLIADRMHLPDILREYGDQEDIFRAMHGLTGWNDLDNVSSDITHIEGREYVVDLFLPFMAQHGYVLRKDPELAGARDLDTSLGQFEQLEREARQSLIDGAAERRKQAGIMTVEQRRFIDAIDATSAKDPKS